VVGDPNQKARPNTVEQLKDLFNDLQEEQKRKVNSYLLKLAVIKFEDLTETQARTLLLNIQAGLGTKQ
jgi:CRISPR/Cas system CSM-associated protein Csm2 small subunit